MPTQNRRGRRNGAMRAVAKSKLERIVIACFVVGIAFGVLVGVIISLILLLTKVL